MVAHQNPHEKETWEAGQDIAGQGDKAAGKSGNQEGGQVK